MGRIFWAYQDWIRIIGGVIVIIFGLFVAGFLRLDFLQYEKRFQLRKKPVGLLGSTVIGMAFAAGWTPCIGPILAPFFSKQAARSQQVTESGCFPCIPWAWPYLSCSHPWLSTRLSYSKRLRRHMRIIMLASGILLISFGILLITNNIVWLSSLFQKNFCRQKWTFTVFFLHEEEYFPIGKIF